MSAFPVAPIARHPPALILRPSTTIREAIYDMADKSVRHAIVSDDGSRLTGIISAKDILNYLGGGEKHSIVQEMFGGDTCRALGSSIEPIINRQPIVGRISTPLPELMAVMAKRDIGMLPLLDEDEHIWGALSERHLFKLFEGNQMFVKVFEIMSKPLVTLDAKSTLIDAMRLMIKNDIRRLVILDEGGVWGIVTVKDIIRFLASPYAEDAINRGLCEYMLKMNISKISTRNPKTVNPDVDLSDAVKIMNAANVGSLIVTVEEKPVGILTERDFLLKLPKLRGVEFTTDVSKNRVMVGRIHF